MTTLPTISYDHWNTLAEAAHDDIEAAHEAANFLNVDFWDCMGCETLIHSDFDDALEAYLDECNGAASGVTVTGYRRAVVPESAWALDHERLLEDLYERLDEDFNSGDEPSVPTGAVIEAAKQLLVIVRREYRPWNCDEAVRVIVSKDEVARRIAVAKDGADGE